MPTLAEYEARGIDVTTMTQEELEADGYVTPMNELPTVVTTVGRYRARNGTVIDVVDVKPRPPLSKTAFTVNGYTNVPRKGREDRRDWNVWHPSGRLLTYRKSAWDIIEKLED